MQDDKSSSEGIKTPWGEVEFFVLYRSSHMVKLRLCLTYGVSSSLSGSVILQSPMKFDIDQREMFCVSLFAGSKQNKKGQGLGKALIEKITRALLVDDPYVHFRKGI